MVYDQGDLLRLATISKPARPQLDNYFLSINEEISKKNHINDIFGSHKSWYGNNTAVAVQVSLRLDNVL